MVPHDEAYGWGIAEIECRQPVPWRKSFWVNNLSPLETDGVASALDPDLTAGGDGTGLLPDVPGRSRTRRT